MTLTEQLEQARKHFYRYREEYGHRTSCKCGQCLVLHRLALALNPTHEPRWETDR